MKKIFLFSMIGLMLFSTACAQEKSEMENKESDDTAIDWLINLEEAQTIAAKEDKAIFVHFTGSDWCGWCKKLKAEVYDHKPFIEYVSEKLVMVKLDFPRTIPQSEEIKKYNKSLARKYGIRGFPTVLLLNAEGEVIGKTGYQAGGPEKYVQHVKEILAQG